MPELCNCEYCLDIWLLRDKGVAEDVIDRIVALEGEVEWYKGVLHGTWPSSREILTEALGKCDG